MLIPLGSFCAVSSVVAQGATRLTKPKRVSWAIAKRMIATPSQLLATSVVSRRRKEGRPEGAGPKFCLRLSPDGRLYPPGNLFTPRPSDGGWPCGV